MDAYTQTARQFVRLLVSEYRDASPETVVSVGHWERDHFDARIRVTVRELREMCGPTSGPNVSLE